jgi:DNA-directed RNA polymerase subunit K/omega
MDYKKSKIEGNTVTREITDFVTPTGNLYESVVIVSKRANSIGLEMKEELNGKLSEFAPVTDNLEEIFENREQIEVAKYYEHLPKPTLVAIHEFLNGETYFRIPGKEEEPPVTL